MSALKAILVLLASLAYIGACAAATSCESGCPVYINAPPPVCGDSKQYMDECRAKCAGAKVIKPGPCPTKKPPCICPEIYKPVCGDGKTYPNACVARCAVAKKITDGPCPCLCPYIYRPVCGSNGVTYANACMARCAGVKRFRRGPCCRPCTMLCVNTYDPVCADGVTYRNHCLTLCLCPRPKRVTPGACKKDAR